MAPRPGTPVCSFLLTHNIFLLLRLRLDKLKAELLQNHRSLGARTDEIHHNQRNREAPVLRQHSLSRLEEQRPRIRREAERHTSLRGPLDYQALRREGGSISVPLPCPVHPEPVRRSANGSAPGNTNTLPTDSQNFLRQKEREESPPRLAAAPDGAGLGRQPVRRQLSLRESCSTVRVVDRYGAVREGQRYGTLREGERYAALRDLDKYATIRGGCYYGAGGVGTGSLRREPARISSIKLQPAQAAAIAAAVSASRQAAQASGGSAAPVPAPLEPGGDHVTAPVEEEEVKSPTATRDGDVGLSR